MLAHRPWDCTDPDQDPPICNSQVLEYFRTMVFRFLNHREWRRHFIHYWEEVPDKEDWMPVYWDLYLRARTPNDPWRDFGPLHPYLRYEEAATRCFTTRAGLCPPDHEVRDWQSWEYMLEADGYSAFWNPTDLF